ncbi:MAG TPA: DUF3185 domain-containing protein [Candidatus Binatia bacterium]
MKINRTILFGIALIVLGIVAFAHAAGENVADPGPTQVSAEKPKTESLVPIFGALVLAGGIVVVAAEARKLMKTK